MKKRIISLLLTLSMIFSAVAMVSCDGGESEGEGTNTGKVAYEVPAEGYDGSAVTITFYHSMGQKLQDVLNTYIPEFNKLYPNITIEQSSMGNYDGVRDQIKTALTAGNQPNIAYCYPDHVALYYVA